jgi:predicted transposase YdaD
VREGERKGKREGKREGNREGNLEGKREDLLQFLKCAGLAITKKERARIEACTDVATLDTWISRVFGAKSAADVLS